MATPKEKRIQITDILGNDFMDVRQMQVMYNIFRAFITRFSLYFSDTDLLTHAYFNRDFGYLSNKVGRIN